MAEDVPPGRTTVGRAFSLKAVCVRACACVCVCVCGGEVSVHALRRVRDRMRAVLLEGLSGSV